MSFVDDLLDMRQLYEGAFRLDNQPFDMHKVLKLIEDIFSPQCKSKGIKLTIETSLDTTDLESQTVPQRSQLPVLCGDARRLKQVLMNLIKNSLKFTQSGEIKLSLKYEAETTKELIVVVTDTGVGFEPLDAEMLFTRFGKLQSSKKLNCEGIGLGLTIVKSIVEKAGGSVSAQSEGVGKGSVFLFTMPLQTVGALELSNLTDHSNIGEDDLIVFDDDPMFKEALKAKNRVC